MELLDPKVDVIKDQISALPRTSHGKLIGISKALRRDIVFGFKHSRMHLKEYCKEIKISETLFYKCRRGLRDQSEAQAHKLGFQKIEIKSEEKHEKYKNQGLILEGPKGLRVIGLEISEVAYLWRALC